MTRTFIARESLLAGTVKSDKKNRRESQVMQSAYAMGIAVKGTPNPKIRK
jgi:hypothetical protein